MFQTILPVAKLAVNITTTVGASKIVRDVIKTQVAQPQTAFQNVQYTAGAFALGGLVAAETSKYTDQQMEKTVEFFRNLRKKKTENTEETTPES